MGNAVSDYLELSISVEVVRMHDCTKLMIIKVFPGERY